MEINITGLEHLNRASRFRKEIKVLKGQTKVILLQIFGRPSNNALNLLDRQPD